MKKDNLIWWVIGGIAAYALYRYYTNKNGVKVSGSTTNLVDVVVNEEVKQFPEPFLAQYNVVLPADMVSKKVKAKGEELRAGRYAIQAQRINNPVYI
jgi:hypothetical protein